MHPLAGNLDHVKINGLRLNTKLAISPWPSRSNETQAGALQPVIISLEIGTNVRKAADTDDFRQSVDYASIYEGLQQLSPVNVAVGPTLEAFAESILDLCLCEQFRGAEAVFLSIELPKALLRGDSGIIEARRSRGEKQTAEYLYTIKNLALGVLVGAFTHEFEAKQRVRVNLNFLIPATASTASPFNFNGICEVIIKVSSCFTTEEAR